MVTEKNMTIRHMRQTAKTVRNYTNFLFSANDLNIMTITDDDRRFNIGTRQDKSIKDTYPNLPREIDDDAQLMKFCRMLNTHNVDKEQVQVLVENAWRTSVQIASMSVADQFFHALQHGDADFFYEEIVLDFNNSVSRIARFLDLEIQPEMLEFWKNRRVVHTASLGQVHKPLYTSSVNSWRRFESHLDVLLRELPSRSIEQADERISSLLRRRGDEL